VQLRNDKAKDMVSRIKADMMDEWCWQQVVLITFTYNCIVTMRPTHEIYSQVNIARLREGVKGTVKHFATYDSE